MTATVLCAIDINRPEEERPVLEMALRQAQLEGGRLDVITVVPDFGSSVVGAYFDDHHVETARDKAGDKLRDAVGAILGAEANANIRHVVAVGSVYQEVLKAARLTGASLIVLGARREDLKDYLLGPNAARVVRHAHCSVYVVRT